MRYISLEDYWRLYPEGQASVEEMEQAEDDIDALTLNRIVARGIEALPEFQRRLVVRAVCRQAEFLHDYGEVLSNPLSSYGINGVSMSWDKKTLVQRGPVRTTNAAYALLQQSGLTYCGLDGRG